MLTPTEILRIVERDVLIGIGQIFVPRTDDGPPFSMLDVGGCAFTERDIPDGAGVSAVPWQYKATHQRPMLATSGVGANGEKIAVLDPDPPDSIVADLHRTGIRETSRKVTIAGVTLVVARTAADEANPTLLRFIDWADVYSQLGLSLSTRVPEVPASGDPGYQRIDQVPSP